MTFIAGAIIWAGYVSIWWGWEAITDHVNPGVKGAIHWPSFKDLVIPARMAYAVPARQGSGGVVLRPGTTDQQVAAAAKGTPGDFANLFPTPAPGTAETPG